jgi:glycosyltransferase involved in cell wall biosynthesis
MQFNNLVKLTDENIEIELSIIMPCLNEERTVPLCVWKARTFLIENGINGEVIVADNMSIDNSILRSQKAGAKIVNATNKGYGSALIAGITASKGKYIIMADADDSYDFLEILPILDGLRKGSDLVMGNRFKNKIQTGAMPFLHKYLGNPILSFLGRIFYNSDIKDFHCGLRGFTRESFDKMDLRTTGMEFASEMIVKANLLKQKIIEVPVKLYPDGRDTKSHLNTWNDGWRHLRFLLLYSPKWLFLYPGLISMFIGFLVLVVSLPYPSHILDIHSIIFAFGAVFIGFQSVFFAISTKAFAIHENLLHRNSRIERILEKLTLEFALIVGTILVVLGILVGVYLFYIWGNGFFFELKINITMRIAILSFGLIVFGFQIIFSFFFYSYLKLQVKK